MYIFIIKHFNLSCLGQNTMENTQIIKDIRNIY